MKEETIKIVSEAVKAGSEINYKQFENMMLAILSEETEYNQKLWLFTLDFMEKWTPSGLDSRNE